MNVAQLEKQLGCKFNDKKLLKQAFTHSSYVNEHQDERFSDNERLEFLGDAVLELGVSNYLFNEKKNMTEGELTKLRASIVCEASLVHFAKDLNFGDYIMLGRGEEQTGGRERPALLADVFEAFLGALYLDQGFDSVVEFLEAHVYPKIEEGAFSHAMDYTSRLQDIIHQLNNHPLEYRRADERGASHDREFVAQVLIKNKVSGEGVGRTKKEAEQRAAKHALDQLNT